MPGKYARTWLDERARVHQLHTEYGDEMSKIKMTVSIDGGVACTDTDIHVSDLARAITPEQVGELLSDMCNRMSISSVNMGFIAAEVVRREHRTLQGCVVNFCLGLLAGMAGVGEFGTDPRNQTAINSCVKIKDMLADGQILYQPLI
jgi:hypothetical protein